MKGSILLLRGNQTPYLFIGCHFAADIQSSGRTHIFLILIIRSEDYQPKMADLLTGLPENQIFTGHTGLLAISAAQSHLSLRRLPL
jgi:hypothetical protein